MHFKLLCILLLMKMLKVDGSRHIPMPLIEQKRSAVVNLTENINLPRGFYPMIPPMNPLLYPFATDDPIKALAGTTSGWRPIITPRTTMTVSRDPHRASKRVDGPMLAPFVYGSRKPEGPVQPEIGNSVQRSATNTNIVRQRIGGFIEQMGRKSASKSSNEKISSVEPENEEINLNKRNQKYGRRKIPNFIGKKNDVTVKPENITSVNVLKVVDPTHPELRNVIKQINESVETPAVVKKPTTETYSSSTETSYAPKLLNSNPKTSREWPIDFISSNEGSQQKDNNPQDDFINYLGDSSDPPPAIASLSFDELLDSPASFNITKMGIPFENVNSSEEPSICVPLSVRERSVSPPREFVDIERVYCFPLPASETKNEMGNRIDNFDNDSNISSSSYDELSISKGMHFRGAILNMAVVSVGLLLI